MALYPSFAHPDTEEHLSFLYGAADMLKNLKRMLERYSASALAAALRRGGDIEEERRFWETLTDVTDSAFHVGCNLHDFAMQAYEAERNLTRALRRQALENNIAFNAPERAVLDRAVLVIGLPDCLYTCIPLWQRVEQLFPQALPFLRCRIPLPEDTLLRNCHQLTTDSLLALGTDIDNVDNAFHNFCSWRFTQVLI
jgi:hypothetical protein